MKPTTLKHIEKLTDHLPKEQRIKTNLMLYSALVAKKNKHLKP